MVEIAFTVKDARVRRMLRRAGPAVDGLLRGSLRDVLLFHERNVKKSFGPYRGRAYSDRLQTRSGATRASVKAEIQSGGARGSVSVSGPHVLAQEFGATIRPNRARFLRIPLPSILTGSGLVRGRFALRREGGRFVTDAGPTFIRRNKSGTPFIFVEDAGRLRALYVLRRQVRLDPRLGFVRRFREEAVPFARKRLRTAARDIRRRLER